MVFLDQNLLLLLQSFHEFVSVHFDLIQAFDGLSLDELHIIIFYQFVLLSLVQFDILQNYDLILN